MVADHIHSKDRNRIDASINVVLDGSEEAWADDCCFLCADGTYPAVYDRGHVIRIDLGKPLRMTGAFLDLAGAKAAEADLKESLRRHEGERSLVKAVAGAHRRLDRLC